MKGIAELKTNGATHFVPNRAYYDRRIGPVTSIRVLSWVVAGYNNSEEPVFHEVFNKKADLDEFIAVQKSLGRRVRPLPRR